MTSSIPSDTDYDALAPFLSVHRTVVDEMSPENRAYAYRCAREMFINAQRPARRPVEVQPAPRDCIVRGGVRYDLIDEQEATEMYELRHDTDPGGMPGGTRLS